MIALKLKSLKKGKNVKQENQSITQQNQQNRSRQKKRNKIKISVFDKFY